MATKKKAKKAVKKAVVKTYEVTAKELVEREALNVASPEYNEFPGCCGAKALFGFPTDEDLNLVFEDAIDAYHNEVADNTEEDYSETKGGYVVTVKGEAVVEKPTKAFALEAAQKAVDIYLDDKKAGVAILDVNAQSLMAKRLKAEGWKAGQSWVNPDTGNTLQFFTKVPA